MGDTMTDFSGFDEAAEDFQELADDFEEMAENAEELDGENEVNLSEILTEEFMREHTDTTSFDDFLENSPWTVESEEDFEEIPEEEFDQYIQENSDFDSWDKMVSEAGKEWMLREIGLR